MSDKAQYARIHNRDSVLGSAKHTSSPPESSSPASPSGAGTQPRPSLRKKVSRAFGSLARRASSASLKGERREETPPPPVPPIERKATTSTTSSTSSSSSRNAVADREEERRDTSTANAIISYSYPVWRVDPVLIGCFVCL